MKINNNYSRTETICSSSLIFLLLLFFVCLFSYLGSPLILIVFLLCYSLPFIILSGYSAKVYSIMENWIYLQALSLCMWTSMVARYHNFPFWYISLWSRIKTSILHVYCAADFWLFQEVKRFRACLVRIQARVKLILFPTQWCRVKICSLLLKIRIASIHSTQKILWNYYMPCSLLGTRDTVVSHIQDRYLLQWSLYSNINSI